MCIRDRITEVNSALEDQPELVNEDPYGDGWVCAIRPAAESELDALMDAASYEKFVSEESQE